MRININIVILLLLSPDFHNYNTRSGSDKVMDFGCNSMECLPLFIFFKVELVSIGRIVTCQVFFEMFVIKEINVPINFLLVN